MAGVAAVAVKNTGTSGGRFLAIASCRESARVASQNPAPGRGQAGMPDPAAILQRGARITRSARSQPQTVSTSTAVMAVPVRGRGGGRRGPGPGVVGAPLPVRGMVQVGSGWADEGVKQAPEFGHGQRDELLGAGSGAPAGPARRRRPCARCGARSTRASVASAASRGRRSASLQRSTASSSTGCRRCSSGPASRRNSPGRWSAKGQAKISVWSSTLSASRGGCPPPCCGRHSAGAGAGAPRSRRATRFLRITRATRAVMRRRTSSARTGAGALALVSDTCTVVTAPRSPSIRLGERPS